MPRLTWTNLIIEDITPEEFTDWMTPWIGHVTGPIAPALMTRFGIWFLQRLVGHVEASRPSSQRFGKLFQRLNRADLRCKTFEAFRVGNA